MIGRLRVLLIEDSASDAKMIALALRQGRRSVEYECVEDAASMRAALAKSAWDLIIADWSMPRFSALAALDIVKELGLDTPFIVLSGVVGEEWAVEAMRAGARDFLVKDDLARLNPAVERELRAHKEGDTREREVARARDEGLREALEETGTLSLARRLRRTFLEIAGTVGVAFAATALSLCLVTVWLEPELADCRAAKDAASDLNTAMIDEETGLRGFLLTRDRTSLEPYYRGEIAASRANDQLAARASSEFAVALAQENAALQVWREKWARPVAQMMGDDAAPSVQDGKMLFDAYRAEHAVLESAIADRTVVLSRRLQRGIGVNAALELAILGALLILASRQHDAVRDAIVAPVAALLRDIGRVRDGELVTTIHQAGPSELRQLGAGLNDMVRALLLSREVAESRAGLLREHANRLRQILDASREFSESLNLEYVIRSVTASTRAVGGYDEVIVWLMEDDQKGLRDTRIAESSPPPEATGDDTLAWRAAKSGRITFEGLDGRFKFGDGGAARVRARAIPLIVGARVVGALEARHSEPQAASGETIEVLEMLAAHAATAIESARLNRINEERSEMDPLTRLHNRRRLEGDLDAECKRCARYSRPLSFVMLDVDYFKAFNDTHGHPRADVALQEVAEVIGGTVRSTDSAYRYGGEEFCILLRETDADSAMHFAERLRQRIELRFANETSSGLTASFGVAELSVDIQTPRNLIEAADAAMYESKRGGRNRVVLSTAPPAMASDSAIPAASAERLTPTDSCTVPTALAAPGTKEAGGGRA